MFDYQITSISTGGDFFCAVLFFSTLLLFWKRCTSVSPQPARVRRWLAFFFVVFVLTAWYAGDFFGYQSIVKACDEISPNYHVEPIYQWIILHTHNNYIVFRLIVWGGSVWLLWLISKAYEVSQGKVLFIVFLLFISTFSYARATLAMAIFFSGYSMVSNAVYKSRNLYRFLMGYALIVLSYFFHNSLFLLIALSFIHWIPLNNKTIIPITLSLLVVAFVANRVLASPQSILSYLDDDSRVSGMFEAAAESTYMLKGGSNANLFGAILIVWQYIPFYYSFVVISLCLRPRGVMDVIKPQISALYKITYAIIILATFFLFFTSKSLLYFYRYLFMSMIPLSVLIVYLYETRIMSRKRFRSILFVCGGYNIVMFLFKIVAFL